MSLSRASKTNKQNPDTIPHQRTTFSKYHFSPSFERKADGEQPTVQKFTLQHSVELALANITADLLTGKFKGHFSVLSLTLWMTKKRYTIALNLLDIFFFLVSSCFFSCSFSFFLSVATGNSHHLSAGFL